MIRNGVATWPNGVPVIIVHYDSRHTNFLLSQEPLWKKKGKNKSISLLPLYIMHATWRKKVEEYAYYFHEIYLDWCSSTLRAESFGLMHINWLKPLMASYGPLLCSRNLFKLRDETSFLSFVSPPLLCLSSLWPCLSKESNLHHGKWWWPKNKEEKVANSWFGKKRNEYVAQRAPIRHSCEEQEQVWEQEVLFTIFLYMRWGQIINPNIVTNNSYACIWHTLIISNNNLETEK